MIGMCTSLTKKPTKPMIRKPIIVADAMRALGREEGIPIRKARTPHSPRSYRPSESRTPNLLIRLRCMVVVVVVVVASDQLIVEFGSPRG